VLQLAWLEVGRDVISPVRAELGSPPRLYRTAELGNFFEQIGRNTAYIIHPEEILADNFAQLATGQEQTVPSPEVQQRIRAALNAAR